MKTKLARVVAISLVIVLAGLVLGSTPDRDPIARASYEASLQEPPFLNEDGVDAESAVLDIGERLDDEAGISAWCQTPMGIDLDLVADQYQIIETRTDDYILGSVSVPGYAYDEWDQHVYVHTDGWILAYYMNTDVTGRVVHLLGQTINSTLVENMVHSMAAEAGMSCSTASLYDFRYPNATNVLFVAENDADGATYTINMPQSYTYMDRAWAKWNSNSYCGFTIDGAQLPATVDLGVFCIGTITYAQLLPGVTHTVDVNSSYSDYGVIMVTYAVP